MGKSQEACQVTQIKNPCWKENIASHKCIDDNNYDKSKCNLQFDNYNACKKFWGSVYYARKREGLYPYVPESEEERTAFKLKYKQTGQIPTTAE